MDAFSVVESVLAALRSEAGQARNGSTKPAHCKGAGGDVSPTQAYLRFSEFEQRRAAPHCMVVNLVRSGRKQPQLFSASAGGPARLPFSLNPRQTTMILRRLAVALVALAGFSSSPAYCVDGFAAELGNGESVDMGRISVQWDWKRRLLQWSDWHLGGYWDLAAGYWNRGNARAGENKDLFDVGFTPVFRIQPNGLAGPYAEFAVG